MMVYEINLADLVWPSISTLFAIELIFRLKWSRLVRSLLIGMQKTIISLCTEDMNDEQREVALRQAAFSMLSVSFKTLGALILVTLAFFSDDLLSVYFRPSTLTNTQGFIYKFLWALIYWSLRLYSTRRPTQSEHHLDGDGGDRYSEISQALHHFALEDSLIAKLSFQLEKKRYLSIDQPMSHNPLWVCGLARAGTTILTDVLYETGHFTSLTYRDMPFPLAPNFWRMLSRFGIGGSREKIERAHGDGLMVNIDSPEALEEVFWRAHEPMIYQSSYLDGQTVLSPNSLKGLEKYIALILKANLRKQDEHASRYLSKNNNHLIRLPALLAHFPQAQIIIPLRHPLEHAESLRRQHERWVNRHEEDRFSQSYMTWLAHHEFGSGHKPFRFTDPLDDSQQSTESPDHIVYWAERWFDTYTWIDSLSSSQLVMIDYDDLSTSPQKTLSALFKWLNLSLSHEQTTDLANRFRPAPKRVDPTSLNPQLVEKVEQLYRALYSKCLRG
jgi:hypothetical protein